MNLLHSKKTNSYIFQTIVIGSDHAGFKLKSHLLNTLSELSKTDKIHLEIKDIGTFNLEESIDYPDYAAKVAGAMRIEQMDTAKPNSMGILICGTGIGMSIKANRYSWIRAALCHNAEYAKMARQHNDANVLIVGGRYTGSSDADEILKIFLTTSFEGGRHKKRVEKL